MPHEWDKNTPSEGWSTCVRCGMSVKTYKARKGGLPTCEKHRQFLIQAKLDEKPPCEYDKRAIACLKCRGRFDTRICDSLRKNVTPIEQLLSSKKS